MKFDEMMKSSSYAITEPREAVNPKHGAAVEITQFSSQFRDSRVPI